MKKLSKFMVIFLIFVGFTLPVSAQESNNGQQAGQGRFQRSPGQRGMMFDPAQIQQMMGTRFKEMLGLNDEEWKVIGPKVIKVFEMSFQQRGNPMRMFGNRGPRPQGQQGQRQGNSPQRGQRNFPFQANAADESMQQLQKLLENKDASAADIKNAVNKVRMDREKKEQEKLAAQKELRELLTVRQEAILISMGLLD